jgi:bifunctional DNase/RNase
LEQDEMQNSLQVLDIEVLFPTAGRNVRTGLMPGLPVLRLYLEDGSDFVMGSIPTDTAIAILQKIQNKSNMDSRYSCPDVLCEITQVETVTIDCLVPRSNAYAATIQLRVEGFADREITFQMVPSQAVLVALTADAPIFVSNELIELQKRQNE